MGPKPDRGEGTHTAGEFLTPAASDLPQRPADLPAWAADLEERLLKGEKLTPAVQKTLQGEPLTPSEAAALTAKERLTVLAIFCGQVRAKWAREGVTPGQAGEGAGDDTDLMRRTAEADRAYLQAYINGLREQAEREG
jgi:hypothetical protein